MLKYKILALFLIFLNSVFASRVVTGSASFSYTQCTESDTNISQGKLCINANNFVIESTISQNFKIQAQIQDGILFNIGDSFLITYGSVNNSNLFSLSLVGFLQGYYVARTKGNYCKDWYIDANSAKTIGVKVMSYDSSISLSYKNDTAINSIYCPFP